VFLWRHGCRSARSKGNVDTGARQAYLIEEPMAAAIARPSVAARYDLDDGGY
jgi:hypothetical protein